MAFHCVLVLKCECFVIHYWRMYKAFVCKRFANFNNRKLFLQDRYFNLSLNDLDYKHRLKPMNI